MNSAPFQLVFSVIKAVCRFCVDVAASPEQHDDDRQLCDSDLIGEFNHRSGRLDAGNDPFGWYDQD
jgi:hypothetical protein|tara:strand:+ start:7705 stop:7902 length:198 start_codon:yes stop_codon:yes gene_type:complete